VIHVELSEADVDLVRSFIKDHGQNDPRTHRVGNIFNRLVMLHWEYTQLERKEQDDKDASCD
jgi:hypothetical protein